MRILCYGDSNTWGTIADGTCGHLDIQKRYATLLKKELLSSKLFDNVEVICEGMPARTTNIDDIKFPKGNRNGSLFFYQCLISHDPIDYVVIALGANDLKHKFNRTAEDVAEAIEQDYIIYTKNHLHSELTKIPQFIISCPAQIDETKFDGFEGATEKSKHLNKAYENMAQKHNCIFISNQKLSVGKDGLHITEQSHKTLANLIAKAIIKNEEKN